jgi:phosphoribosyl 1,2-cyclic phosphodiesterase
VRVHLLGVRGSTPAPGIEFVRYGGFTSAVAVSHDGDEFPTLILDAGTGLRRFAALFGDRPFRGSILLSHVHWDHTHGLPFFSSGDREGSRVTVAVPEQLDGSGALEVLSRGMSPPHFPVSADQLRGDWTFMSLAPGTQEFEGFSVMSAEIPHKGGRTFGFRVSDGHSVLTYMPDHCPTEIGPGPEGWGEYHEQALALCVDADAVLHDASLIAEEVAAEAYFGHAAAEYAVELGRRSGARKVVLFHHKPDRTDDQLDVIARRFDPEAAVLLAAESMVLDL